MALPKEPRQKMINMMYLVLTALLALNVSSEILNAFRTVNTSINSASRVIDEKNETTYKSFEQKLKDANTREKTAIWWPKAQKARQLSDAMSKYIENVKTELKNQSDGKNLGTATEEFREDDLNASSRYLVEGPSGKELQKKLQDYRNEMLAVVPEMKDYFSKSLPLDLSVPVSRTGSSANDEWTSAYFRMTPTIASLTILSKFQNDVKNSEAQIVDYCHKEIGEVEVIFDEFQAFAGTNSTYLMPGENLEITAGVGAFSKAARPTVYINGAAQPLNNDGVAVYKTSVSGAGEKRVSVKIGYTKPDGTPGTVEKTVAYTVGVPSGASVFLEKMNVLYTGVDNPVTISAGSAGLEKMNVSFTGGGGVRSAGGQRYILKPDKVGPANINVTVNGKTTPFAMRVKRLPDPTGMVGGSKGGSFSTANFKAQGGLIARLMDSDFDAEFKVISYSLSANGGAFQTYQSAQNQGARWSGTAANIVSRATPGASVFFEQIKVQGPDGVTREIPPIIFQLK